MNSERRGGLLRRLGGDGRSEVEVERLGALVELFVRLPEPPDPAGLFPRFGELQARLRQAVDGDDGEELEEALLELYAHVHGHEAPYTPAERSRVDETGGYWCHAGGLSPILKAPDFLPPHATSLELGAGNGLQLLLMQWLAPHARSVMVEISSRMVESGRELQRWLGIAAERVEWTVGDVGDSSPRGMDFIYLYRPVRPEGPGRGFYERFAAELDQERRPLTIFSIADCLREFLPSSFEVFHTDGHLTCFRRGEAPE